jgi:urocanate hydratase
VEKKKEVDDVRTILNDRRFISYRYKELWVGTYETFSTVAKILAESLIRFQFTAGLGGMGGAQPLAVTMNEGVCLVAEVEDWRIDKRLSIFRYKSNSIDETIDRTLAAKRITEKRTVNWG